MTNVINLIIIAAKVVDKVGFAELVILAISLLVWVDGGLGGWVLEEWGLRLSPAQLSLARVGAELYNKTLVYRLELGKTLDLGK